MLAAVLKKATYGTRDAAQNWELEYTEMMTEAGFRQGSFSACVFYHEQKNVRVVARGGDFTALGPSKSLDWFSGVVQQRMEVKFKGRLERGEPGAVRILNRTGRWCLEVTTWARTGWACSSQPRRSADSRVVVDYKFHKLPEKVVVWSDTGIAG